MRSMIPSVSTEAKLPELIDWAIQISSKLDELLLPGEGGGGLSKYNFERGGIDLGYGSSSPDAKAGNLDGVYVTFQTSSANAINTVTHNLGRTPKGYWKVKATTSGDMYQDSTTVHDSTYLYVKCSGSTNTVTLFVF
ncbi:MAG: hypothetical protein M0R06_12580 [Sphaerochaeta sp.]|jgi:hypothetical protein|nr:hypothetical protein [Sphaerochaeta sp.]